jgi:signal transduction histidine kinase
LIFRRGIKSITISGESIDRYILAAAAVWSLVFAAAWWHENGHTMRLPVEQALSEARASYYKDVAYRVWASRQGGVYAPATALTPPNEYLSPEMAPERDIATPSGRRLTLVNPAYMTRQVHELARELYAHQGHITSLNPIRPANRADAWETAALLEFERGVQEKFQVIDGPGGRSLRLMRPFITEKSCLRCHASQGYKEGDIRGGISVTIPMAAFDAAAGSRKLHTGLFFLLIWACGLAGLLLLGRRLREYRRQRQTAEEQLERANAILREKQRELEDYLYITTHDLRTPLVNISGFCRLLSESAAAAGGEEERRALAGQAESFIQGSVRRMDELLASLLRMARLGRGERKPQRVDMNALVAGLAAGMKPGLDDAGAEVSVSRLPACLADPGQVEHVLANLLDNALKYRSPARPLRVNISGRTGEGKAVYTVSDNGRGVPPGELEKIWQLFYRADPAGSPPGEGIGLAMARKLAALNGGSLKAAQNAEGGLDFILELPAEAEDD